MTGRSGRATRPAAPPRRASRRARGSRRGGRSRTGSARARGPGRRPRRATRGTRATSRPTRAARSCIRSPTRTTPSTIPSAARLSTAVGVGANSQRDRWSATTRLISSGIRRSKLRSPASTCATGSRAWPPRARRPASSSCRRRRGRRPGRSVDRGSARGRSASARSARPASRRRRPGSWSGAAQAELAEEGAGHRVVVVLAGVDEDLLVSRPEHRLQRGGLDQLGPRPDDADDPHPPQGRTCRPGHVRRPCAVPGDRAPARTPTPR